MEKLDASVSEPLKCNQAVCRDLQSNLWSLLGVVSASKFTPVVSRGILFLKDSIAKGSRFSLVFLWSLLSEHFNPQWLTCLRVSGPVSGLIQEKSQGLLRTHLESDVPSSI